MQSGKARWTAYLMEAGGLGGFVVFAGMLTIFLEHPDLPVMNGFLKDHPLLRRIPLGIIMGVYVALITHFFGKTSGAHTNPAVTWIFFRLGKIKFQDALLYTLFQLAGAVFGALALKYFAGTLFSHERIFYGVTRPVPPHDMATAFIAEFVISFILMAVMLFASSSRIFERKIALITGILICLFLIFELPMSGMSLNPARSFAAAVAANEWDHFWIYLISPPLAMLLASFLFQVTKKKLPAADYKELDIFPAAG